MNDSEEKMKVREWKLFANSIELLGRVMKRGWLDVRSHTIDGTSRLQAPSINTKLHSFFGLCNVFRRSVPNFARSTAHLSRKLQKNQARVYKELSDEELDVLQTLQ